MRFEFGACTHFSCQSCKNCTNCCNCTVVFNTTRSIHPALIHLKLAGVNWHAHSPPERLTSILILLCISRAHNTCILWEFALTVCLSLCISICSVCRIQLKLPAGSSKIVEMKTTDTLKTLREHVALVGCISCMYKVLYVVDVRGDQNCNFWLYSKPRWLYPVKKYKKCDSREMKGECTTSEEMLIHMGCVYTSMQYMSAMYSMWPVTFQPYVQHHHQLIKQCIPI